MIIKYKIKYFAVSSVTVVALWKGYWVQWTQMLYQLQYPADLKPFKYEFLFINFYYEFKGSIASKYLKVLVFSVVSQCIWVRQAKLFCPWPKRLKPYDWGRWLPQRVIKQQTASLKMDAALLSIGICAHSRRASFTPFSRKSVSRTTGSPKGGRDKKVFPPVWMAAF